MMIIYAKLSVKNFTLFEAFESQAAAIMQKHSGHIIRAFETVRHEDDSGEEIHILEFPSEKEFNDYRADSELAQLSELRERAIAKTEVIVSHAIKNY